MSNTLINLNEKTALADADMHYIVDVEDTTQSAEGTSKRISTVNLKNSLLTFSAFGYTYTIQIGGDSTNPQLQVVQLS